LLQSLGECFARLARNTDCLEITRMDGHAQQKRLGAKFLKCAEG
jgi:hypothetical protein